MCTIHQRSTNLGENGSLSNDLLEITLEIMSYVAHAIWRTLKFFPVHTSSLENVLACVLENIARFQIVIIQL